MHKSIFIILFGVIWVALGFSKQRDSLNQNNYNYSEESNLFKKIADVNILTSKGSQKLSSLYGTSPTIIAPIFTRCSGVCNPFLSNLKETVFHLSNAKEFKILVISFDPKDSLENMLKLAERYELNNNKQWVFATTNQITELNKSIGFSPVWDNTKKQFNHDALLVGINENGYIVKKLTGVREAQSLLTMIKEINNEFIL
ncbi:MAG: SCO family protein, partial [Bacteroidia bacterium]|nr:SCO family protein [Bacteroidia bacterium]